jgi:dihydrofolate synthase/folylpolyglutamate synthase
VVIGETQPAVKKIFLKTARQMNAPLVFADSAYKAKIKASRRTDRRLVLDVFSNRNPVLKNLALDLAGHYQRKNVCTALAAAERLAQGMKIPPQAVRTGLENASATTGFMGRWQLLNKSPLALCDAGHNDDGIREVAGQLKSMKYDRLHIVLGVVMDKDFISMLRLLPRQASYYYCKAAIPRGLDAGELARHGARLGLKGDAWPSVRQAYQAALNQASRNDLVFVGGSTFTIAEVL